MKKDKPDWIFECRKCNHVLYILKDKMKKMIGFDCPNCGEESPTFTFIGEGDFNKI